MLSKAYLLYCASTFLVAVQANTKKTISIKEVNEFLLITNNNRTIIFSGEAAKLNAILRKDQFLDTVSFRELKKRINVYERFIALHPDSIIVRQTDFPQKLTQIDSFYVNKYKIKYLKRNKITSPNIHF
jgi:hypothetical protein